MRKFKLRIYNLIQDDDPDVLKINIFDSLIIFLIFLNIILVIIDTFNIPKSIESIFDVIEVISITIFTIEYLLRVWTSDLIYPNKNKLWSRLKYIFSFMAIVDLLSILPFFIPFIIPIDLRTLRIFRLFRLVRLFKFNRYTSAFSNIMSVIKNKADQLISVSIAIFLLMIISSVMMFNLENSVQPDIFENAFSGFWWTLDTITSAGFNEIQPMTTIGKILSGVVSLLGVGFIAIPTGIISAGFVENTKEQRIERTRMERIQNDLLILSDLFDQEIITKEEYINQKEFILNRKSASVVFKENQPL